MGRAKTNLMRGLNKLKGILKTPCASKTSKPTMTSDNKKTK